MFVCIYCRVSSEEQAEKDNSIPAQRKLLLRWAAQHGMTVVKEFLDEGESAYAPANKRPGFMEMMSFCKKKGAQLILVHKLDRFSRNREESILFKGMLRKAGVAVKSISEDFDPETPSGFLYEGMIEVINQFYSMNLATETLKGMRENAERGFHNGGQTPYGFRLEPITEGTRTRSRLVHGPEDEVFVVKEIFRLAGEEGSGALSVASELNRRGYKGPRGGHWSKETISMILSNPVYKGDLAWRRRKTVNRTQRKVTDPNEWVVYPGAVEPMVSSELFDRRKAQSAARPFQAGPARDGHGKYLLSRLIRCGHCGNNFVGKHQKYRTRTEGELRIRQHYSCLGYLAKGSSVCPSNLIPVEWADSSVVDLIARHVCGNGRLVELEQRVRQKLEAKLAAASADSVGVAKRIQEVERRIGNFYRAIGDGMDVAVCRQHIAELQERKAALEKEAELAAQEDYHAQTLNRCVDSMKHFASSFGTGFEELPLGIRRQVVRYFVSRIEVNNRDEFRVVLRIPFDDRGLKLLTEEMETHRGGSEGVDVKSNSALGSGVYPDRVAGGANLLRLDNENLLEWTVDLTIPRLGKFSRSRTYFPLEALKRTRRFRASSFSSIPDSGNIASGHIDTKSVLELAKDESRQGAFFSPRPDPGSGTPQDILSGRSTIRRTRGASSQIEAGEDLSGDGQTDRAPAATDQAPVTPQKSWAERRARLRQHIQRAVDWSGELERGTVENAAGIAAREGLTRARVCQLLRMAQLAPEILEDLSDPTRTGPVPTEHQLREVAVVKSPKAQLKRYAFYIKRLALPETRAEVVASTRRYQRGFQHLFTQARRYRDLCKSGLYGSLKEVGKVDGVTGERVGQLLSLLTLAPDIIARLDVPVDQRPAGVRWDDLRRLTKYREPAEQVREFEALLIEGQRSSA